MNSIYESADMKAARLKWALMQWAAFPMATQNALKPVLEVAVRSQRDTSHLNEVFQSVANLPHFRDVARWEWSGITSVLSTLIKQASDEQLEGLIP